MYRYPRVYFDHLRKDKAIVPGPGALYVLEQLLLALLLDEATCPDGRCFAHRLDGAGARPQHGLLLSNTAASLVLVLDAFRSRPSLIPLRHVGQPFEGENSLHVLAVNKKEAELCEVIEIATSSLDPPELRETFRASASGKFFGADPMDFYGSTPLGYCVAFSLEEALRTLLLASRDRPSMAGLVELNDPTHACPLTGFLPLHVAVANSLTGMFNFLTDLPGLPIEFDDRRASTHALSQYGKRVQWAVLTPLQLGVKLGDKRMVQYILRTQSSMEWVWGPVSQWHLDLRGIDSVGDTGNDVMEILGQLDASAETQEMLLDSFVQGIFHELFRQKFRRFGRPIVLVMRGLDLGYLICMFTTAVLCKRFPDALLDDDDAPGGAFLHWVASYVPYAAFAFMLPMLEEDLRSAVVWWQTARGARARSEESKELMLASRRAMCAGVGDGLLLLQWMQSHQMPTRFVGWMLSGTVMVLLLRFREMARDQSNHPFWDASSASAAEQLSSLLVPLALGTALHTTAFFRAVLAPFEKLGIFYNTVFKMLASDVTYWLALFLIFLLNYGFVMYVCYPPNFDDPAMTSGGEPVPSFVGFGTAFWALFELAFLGERVDMDISVWRGLDTSSPKGFWGSISFLTFLGSYVVYIIMSLVLLLNLLIAMMGDTYQNTMEHATLEWRVNYARWVLRIELQISMLHRWGWVHLNCGERRTDALSGHTNWVHAYKVYERNAEGGGARGKNRTPMFEESVEEEADLHVLDDDGPGAGDAETTLVGERELTESPTARKPPPGMPFSPRAMRQATTTLQRPPAIVAARHRSHRAALISVRSVVRRPSVTPISTGSPEMQRHSAIAADSHTATADGAMHLPQPADAVRTASGGEMPAPAVTNEEDLVEQLLDEVRDGHAPSA